MHPDPELSQAQRQRSTKLRRLGLLGLALLALAFALPVRSAEGWTPEMKASLFVTCVEKLDDPRFCACAVDVLTAIAPDPASLTEADARAAFEACPAPRPRAPELKI